MIVLDEEDHDQSKLELDRAFDGPTLRIPERAFTSNVSLPDYQTSQREHRTVSTFEIDDGSSTHSNAGYLKQWWQFLSGRTFWRRVGYVLLGYIVLTAVLGVPLIVLKLRHRSQTSRVPWVPPPSWNAPVSAASQNLGGFLSVSPSNQDCNQWNGTTRFQQYHYANLTREYPVFDTFAIESDYRYNISNSRALFGTLRVGVNPNKAVRNLQIDVRLKSTNPSLINNSQFCFFNEHAARGLKIIAPTNLTQDDLLDLDVRLLFPNKPPKNTKTMISQFSTYLPVFRQDFGALTNYVFADARIEGPLSNITIDSLYGEKVAIKSSLAPIAGNFTVSQSLSLDTIGSPIVVNAVLSPSESNGSASLTATTGNGPIKANITLKAHPYNPADPDGGPNMFITELISFNGAIIANASHDPTSPPSNLFMRVQNNLGIANVSLDRKFIGTFDVQTKLAPVSVTGTTQLSKKPPISHTHTNGNTTKFDAPTFMTVDSAERSYGWANLGMNPDSEMLTKYGHVEVTSSMAEVELMIEGVESSHSDERLVH